MEDGFVEDGALCAEDSGVSFALDISDFVVEAADGWIRGTLKPSEGAAGALGAKRSGFDEGVEAGAGEN